MNGRARLWASKPQPNDLMPVYLVRDNYAAYGQAFKNRLMAMGIRDRPIIPRSPWQNGITERVIGTLAASAWIKSLSSVRRTCDGYFPPM